MNYRQEYFNIVFARILIDFTVIRCSQMGNLVIYKYISIRSCIIDSVWNNEISIIPYIVSTNDYSTEFFAFTIINVFCINRQSIYPSLIFNHRIVLDIQISARFTVVNCTSVSCYIILEQVALHSIPGTVDINSSSQSVIIDFWICNSNIWDEFWFKDTCKASVWIDCTTIVFSTIIREVWSVNIQEICFNKCCTAINWCVIVGEIWIINWNFGTFQFYCTAVRSGIWIKLTVINH